MEQTEIVGHSVRAVYLCSAVTDLAAEYDDEELRAAVRRLWHDLTTRKLYVTGGVGADPSIEGFGAAYELPDADGYAETCAAIGLVQWAQRMGNATGQGAYLDVLERSLYNGVLSGASADGTHYFYGNPLASNGTVHRDEWFGVACCPPNLARLLSELGHYVYASGDREAVVNLFVAGTAHFRLEDGDVQLSQQTRYPQDGQVRIAVDPATDGQRFTVAVRIPGWSRPLVTLNGTPLEAPVILDGYLVLDREWAAGDAIELDLRLSVRRTWAHPAVTAATGRVALERGPVVFCLEGVDHDHPVHTLTLSRDSDISAVPDDSTGVVTLHAAARAAVLAGDAPLYSDVPPELVDTELHAVPYFSWANRGPSDMTVWIHEQLAADRRDDDGGL